jgi:hypothetical protein
VNDKIAQFLDSRAEFCIVCFIGIKLVDQLAYPPVVQIVRNLQFASRLVGRLGDRLFVNRERGRLSLCRISAGA